MPDKKWRIEIVCEDRRTERFLRKICDVAGVRVLRVDVAPAGKGSGSDWVLQRYPDAVRRGRSKSFQRFLGLLVDIDGDNQGIQMRKAELSRKLEEAGLPDRTPEEAITVFVPTWSIETWLAYLNDSPGVTEHRSLKDEAPFSDLWQDKNEATTLRLAAAKWAGSSGLPSLDDSHIEARRIGLL